MSPSLPYSISGTVYRPDGSTALASAVLKFKNNTQGGTGFTITTDSNGQYVGNLGNFGNDWTTGDEIYIVVSDKKYFKFESFTIASEESRELNITTKGLRQYVFDAVYTLINANKSSAWSLLSAFPDQSPTFPTMVINPAEISMQFINISNSERDHMIELSIDYWSKSSKGKEQLDTERDTTGNTIEDNEATLRFKGLELMKPDFLNDTSIGEIVFNRQKLNTGTQILRLRYDL